METSLWVPLIAAMVGGVIALTGSVLTSRVKANADRRRELMALAVQTGIEAFKADRSSHGNTELRDLPLSFYIYFHCNYLHLVEKNPATSQEVTKINEKLQELLTAVKQGPWGKALETQRRQKRTERENRVVRHGQDVEPPASGM